MNNAVPSPNAACLRRVLAWSALAWLPLHATDLAAPASHDDGASASSAAAPPSGAAVSAQAASVAPAHAEPAPAAVAPAHAAPKAAAPAPKKPPAHAAAVTGGHPSPEAALQRLIDGNARYVAGHAVHPNQSVARRIEVVAGQEPFAVIVTCSDSRVAPELYFDQGIGDLFVVRGAGNVLNDHVIGSIEYAVEHLHAAIILVVGHEKCGAVAAAIAGGRAEGRIGTIIEAIRPAVKETRNQAGDKTDNAIRGHARRVAKTLAVTAPILSHAVQTGEIKIFAARYDLSSGRVELLP
jgi:carbonic anhydrase